MLAIKVPLEVCMRDIIRDIGPGTIVTSSNYDNIVIDTSQVVYIESAGLFHEDWLLPILNRLSAIKGTRVILLHEHELDPEVEEFVGRRIVYDPPCVRCNENHWTYSPLCDTCFAQVATFPKDGGLPRIGCHH